MDLLKQVCAIEASATKRFLIRNEFVVGKNEIQWVDLSFRSRIRDAVIKAQKGVSLVCDMVQQPGTSRHIIDARGGIEKAQITMADLLVAIRSGKLGKEARYACIINDSVVRINWVRDGWSLHVYAIDVPGEWSIGCHFIFRNVL